MEQKHRILSLIMWVLHHPVDTILTTLGLLGVVLLFIGFVKIEPSPPYVDGVRPIEDGWPIIVIGSVLILGSIWILIRRSQYSNGIASSKGRRQYSIKQLFPRCDLDTFSAIFHYKDNNHNISIHDKCHVYSFISTSAVIDKEGNYYGIYERKGTIREGDESDGILIHTAASGPGVDFEDLWMIAFDVNLKDKLHIECVEQTHRCKIYKIYFRSHKSKNASFHIRWMFKWPRCMNPIEDGDALSLSIFEFPPSTAAMSIQLPGEPIIYQTWVAKDKNLKNLRPVEPTKILLDKPHNFFQFALNYSQADQIDGILAHYRLKNEKSKLLYLKDMVQIAQAVEGDLDEVFQIEREIEGPVAAPREVLYERLSMFPQGFLVAKLSNYVVGYIESCIWDRDSYSKFEEIRDFKSYHKREGRYLYIIFVGVAKPFRRKGIATKLLEEIINVARNHRIEEVHVVSKQEITSLYERCGFSSVKNLPNFYNGISGVLMKKQLK